MRRLKRRRALKFIQLMLMACQEPARVHGVSVRPDGEEAEAEAALDPAEPLVHD